MVSRAALAGGAAFGAAAVQAAPAPAPAPAPYEQIIIPLSDGTRLHARLWRPERPVADKVPVVLEWIPYRQSDNTAVGDSMVHGYFAEQGIAAVRIDIRGSGNSDGLLHDEYLKQEQDDALEVIAWLAAQDWCNGNVGMIGISWSGFAGLQIAARRPPALKAIVTCCSTDDRYRDDVHYMGGAMLNDGWGPGLFGQLGRPPDPVHVGAEWRDIWMKRLNGIERSPLESWMSHTERDEFWKHGSVSENYDDIQCAVYAVSGWTDGYSDPVLRLMQNLSVPRKGLIGPWTHIYPTWGKPGPPIGFLQECMRWWRQWLLEEDTGIMDEPMLRLWVGSDLKPDTRNPKIGGDWIGLPAWPVQSATQSFYPNGRELTRRPGAAKAPIRVDTPQHLGAYAGRWCPQDGGGDGPEFQADNRIDDGLSVCFDTLPLTAPVEVVGFPVLKVDLAFEGPKALIIVRLNEVQPDGTSARITYAIRRLKRPDGVAAGERFTAEIPLKGVAYRFKPGARIRLALSTTYWPMVWPEPSQGAITFWPDATSFTLPAMPRVATTRLPEFGPPIHATPVPSETLAQGQTTRMVSWDAMTGRAQLTTTSGGGLRRIDGQTMGGGGGQAHSILPGDGASARARYFSVQTRERPGWSVRTETETNVYWENGKLTMDARYEAFDGLSKVYSRTWKMTSDY